MTTKAYVNKNIKAAAQEAIKGDAWLKDQTKRAQQGDTTANDWTNSVETMLARILAAMKDGRYYTRVESVSKSGMSRVISIGWIENNQMCHAPDYVYRLAGCDKNNRIGGCGMDMLFAAQYNLFTTLATKRTPYQKHMKSYRSY